MANGIFNIARGCHKFYYFAVENSLVLASAGQFTSTANSALIIVGIDVAGTTDDALADFDDLSALLAGTPNEVTATNYARKVLTDADLAAVPAPDDVNNRYDLVIPDQVWTNLISAGGNPNFTDLLVCFDPDTTAGTDSSIIPLTFHDFVVTTDGTDVTADVGTAGYYRSQ